MVFEIQLSMEDVNVILRALDKGLHGEVRRTFDTLLQQVNQQTEGRQTIAQNPGGTD
jgi:hypothetical protein